MEQPTLSQRGEAQYKMMSPFIAKFINILNDGYHAKKNPNGIINLGTAENSLVHDKLIEFYEEKFKLAPQQLQYNDAILGTRHLYNALADFFNTHFKPHKTVTDQHILTGNGASPVLNAFFRCVADKGDGVLIAAPYYVGFDLDLTLNSGVLPIAVPVSQEQIFTMKEVECLERHLEQMKQSGVKIKAVILCNPHNPVGQCYPPEVIVAYAKFCEKHNLHFLSDEIYALSIFPTAENPKPEPFRSALSIDWEAHDVNPARVHVVYGMSKDFNSNSFRIGTLVSQHNSELVTCVLTMMMFSMVSAPAGVLWANVLTDQKFLEGFIAENQKALQVAYEYALEWIKFQKIPYIPSNAGHFLLIDFRPILTDIDKYGSIVPITSDMSMFEREDILIGSLVKHKVFIGSGATFHMPEGGWLRFTFSVERSIMNIALRRLEDMFNWPHFPQREV